MSQITAGLIDAINESNSMKGDINSTMDNIILEAEESEYRPVMDLYKEKVRKFRSILNKPLPEEQICVRKVCFKDGEELCQIIAEGISVEWEDEKEEEEGVGNIA